MTGFNKCGDCKYKHKGIEEIPCCACAYNHEVREDFYIKDDLIRDREEFDAKKHEQDEDDRRTHEVIDKEAESRAEGHPLSWKEL